MMCVRRRVERTLAWAALAVMLCGASSSMTGHAHAATSPPPTAIPPTATVAPQTGQLILGQQHIPQGTTTLDAAVSQFREGQRVTFTWARDNGATAPIGSALVGVGGSATTQLTLPTDAPAATYTVTATGNRGDTATAFVTVDAPGATPAPTALSYSPRLIAPPSFTHGISTTAGTSGNGDQLPIRVLGFPPHATLHITLQLLAHGPHATVDGGNFGPTDATGAAAGDVALPADLPPGPYDVEGTVGTVKTGATVQIQATVADQVAGWDRNVFAGLWANATEGLLTWWQGVTTAGHAALVHAILGVTTVVLDFTSAAYAFLFDLSKPLLVWGGAALFVLVSFRILAEAVTMRAEADGAHHVLKWGLLIGEVAIVLTVAGALKPIEHAVWAWTAGSPKGLGGGAKGLKGYGDALGTWTTYRGPSLQETANWGLGQIAALCLLAILAIQLVLLTLGVLAGWVLKLFLWLTGPLCWAAMGTPHTRPLGLWWTRSMISVSLWIVGWMYLFSVEGAAVGQVARGGGLDPAKAPNTLVAIGVGLVMMLSTNAVPAALRRGTHLLIAGAGGVVDEMAGPGGAVWGWAKNKVPLLGRL